MSRSVFAPLTRARAGWFISLWRFSLYANLARSGTWCEQNEAATRRSVDLCSLRYSKAVLDTCLARYLTFTALPLRLRLGFISPLPAKVAGAGDQSDSTTNNKNKESP